MSSLLSLAPQKAVLAETGEVVAAQDVKVNTVIAVKAGEVVPIDGIVIDGRSEVDESTLTGESFPVSKQQESQVWAGTLNIDGNIYCPPLELTFFKCLKWVTDLVVFCVDAVAGYIAVRTTALAHDSAVAKMARLVEEAQNSRSSTQRLIDTCAKYYTPGKLKFRRPILLQYPFKVPSTKKFKNLEI
jgi:Zn2+/Cd2+-exporting ATPase